MKLERCFKQLLLGLVTFNINTEMPEKVKTFRSFYVYWCPLIWICISADFCAKFLVNMESFHFC